MPSDTSSICESIALARLDPEALGELLEQYRSLLHLRAEQELGPRLRQRFDASDVVQDTLLAAHAKFSLFAGESEARMSAWLFTIFKNVVLTLRKVPPKNHSGVWSLSCGRLGQTDQALAPAPKVVSE